MGSILIEYQPKLSHMDPVWVIFDDLVCFLHILHASLVVLEAKVEFAISSPEKRLITRRI